MKFSGKEKITIIIIVYNVGKYLKECINSIRHQSYENLEIILVDDGSDDGSDLICDECGQLDYRIKVIHKQNGGLISARQAGILQATGEYCAFVDGDDWVDNDMYERLYMIAKLFESEIVLSGIVRENSGNRKCDKNAVPNGLYDKEKLENEIYPKMMYSMENRSSLIDPSLCNKLFLTERIRKTLLRVNPEIFYLGEDAATTFPCLLTAKSIYVTDFCMYHHRIIQKEPSAAGYKREKVYERLLTFYKNLKENFLMLGYDKIMIPQLNGYFLHLLNVITREAIGLDILVFYQYLVNYGAASAQSFPVFKYVFPFDELKGFNNIVLYGAGKVGQDYYQQLQGTEKNIVLWVDKKSDILKSSGMPIESLNEIEKYTYDIILLAAKRENTAESMKADLLAAGVDEKELMWVRPIEKM